MAQGERARRSEQEFPFLLSKGIGNVPNYAVFFLDTMGIVRSWNEGAGNLFGRTTNEAIGFSFERIFTGNDIKKDIPRSSLKNALSNRCFEFIGWLERKDGSLFWASATITRLDVNDQHAGYTVIVRDLQKRKEAEDLAARWQQAFEHAGWGVVLANPQTDILELLNPAFARMHGYSVEELTGKHMSTVFAPEALPSLMENIKLVHEKGHHSFESLHVRKDGTTFPVLIDSTAVKDENGKALYRAVNVRDITDLKEAERVLKQSREKYRSLIELASDGIFIADLSGRYTDVNTAGCRMLGYSRDEIIGKTIVDLIPPEEVTRLWQSREQMMKPGQTHVAEWHLKKKDGTYIPVEVSAAILTDGRWQGFVRDISKRRAAEQALQQSEQKFRGLIENAHDAVLIFDKNGKIEFANMQVKKMFGYEPADLIGKLPETLVPERFKRKHVLNRLNYMTRPVAKSMGENIELIGKRKDGSEFPVDISITPFESKTGTFVTAFVRDSTAQKQFGVQQRFVAETSRIITETMDYQDRVQKIAECVVPFIADWCIVLLVEDDKLHTKAVAHCDKKKEQLLLSMDDFFSTLCKVPLHTEAHEMLSASVVEEFTEQKLYDHARGAFQNESIRKLKPVSFIAVPLIARAKIIGMLYLGMSESGRRFNSADRSFTLLLAARFAMAVDNARLYLEAQDAIRARENILSIVSHDLKNPITVIKNSSYLIDSLMSSEDRDKIRKVLGTLERSIAHMERLVSDLMDFSKIEARTLRMEMKQVDVKNILDDVIEQYKQRAAEKSIRLSISDVSITIQCDPDRIKQVLSNIIGNAIKFTPGNGSVTLDVQKEKEDFVLFSVSDTGPGISKEDQAHVFDRFWQAKKTAHMGAGLGLYIAKVIVEAHGGRIWLESGPGKGTTFFFSIPRRAKSEV